MSEIRDPRIDALLRDANFAPRGATAPQQTAMQMAVIAMTPEMYVGAQVLASLSQAMFTEEAWHDETLRDDIVDRSIALTKEFLKKLG
jgi:acyl-CoA synthetase (NDP forming)